MSVSDRPSFAALASQLAEFNKETERVMGFRPIDPETGIPDWALHHRRQMDEERAAGHKKVSRGDSGAGEDVGAGGDQPEDS